MNIVAFRTFVNDIEAAKYFYKTQLGLSIKADGSHNGYCVFESAGIDLVVECVDGDAPKEERAYVGRFTGISFGVADIQTSYRLLRSQQVRFEGEPEKQDWGGWIATLFDPSNNQLQLVEYPK
jgi:predicted enzyme related to lactoylglutathione lyase